MKSRVRFDETRNEWRYELLDGSGAVVMAKTEEQLNESVELLARLVGIACCSHCGWKHWAEDGPKWCPGCSSRWAPSPTASQIASQKDLIKSNWSELTERMRRGIRTFVPYEFPNVEKQSGWRRKRGAMRGI